MSSPASNLLIAEFIAHYLFTCHVLFKSVPSPQSGLPSTYPLLEELLLLHALEGRLPQSLEKHL